MPFSNRKLKNKLLINWKKNKLDQSQYSNFIIEIEANSILSLNSIKYLFKTFKDPNSYFFQRIFIQQFKSFNDLDLFLKKQYEVENYISRIWLYSFNITKKIDLTKYEQAYKCLYIDKMIYLIFRKFKSMISLLEAHSTIEYKNIVSSYYLIDTISSNMIKPNYYQQWLMQEVKNSSIYTDLYYKIPIYKKKYCSYIKEKECQIVS